MQSIGSILIPSLFHRDTHIFILYNKYQVSSSRDLIDRLIEIDNVLYTKHFYVTARKITKCVCCYKYSLRDVTINPFLDTGTSVHVSKETCSI